MLLLKRSDPVCYDDLVEELRRSITVGRDEYPEMAPAAYDLLTRRCDTFDSQGEGNRSGRGGDGRGHGRGRPGGRGRGQENIQVAFAQRQQ
eukprot:5157140-Ditylum_brightwellii.AAC.1